MYIENIRFLFITGFLIIYGIVFFRWACRYSKTEYRKMLEKNNLKNKA